MQHGPWFLPRTRFGLFAGRATYEYTEKFDKVDFR